MRASRRTAGFTLIELLLVMGLLTAFSYMAFRLMSGGLSVWKAAEASRDQEERARAVLDLLRRDLSTLDGSPTSPFVVSYGNAPKPPAPKATKNAPAVVQEPLSVIRVRGVRTFSRGEELRWIAAKQGLDSLAEVGETAAAAPTPVPGTPKKPRGPSPTLGLLEFAYSVADDPTVADPAFLTLRRAVRPVDPDDALSSFFVEDFFDRPKKGFADASHDVVGGLLYFGLDMANAKTASWDTASGPGAPHIVWDSTRGSFLAPRLPDPNLFQLSVEGGVHPRERTYPRTVRVTLMLRREERDQRVVSLAKALDARAKEIILDDPRPLPIAAGDFVKIGTEWMQVAGAESRKLRISVRGALRTVACEHAEGLEVHRGRRFHLEVPIAAAREVPIR